MHQPPSRLRTWCGQGGRAERQRGAALAQNGWQCCCCDGSTRKPESPSQKSKHIFPFSPTLSRLLTVPVCLPVCKTSNIRRIQAPTQQQTGPHRLESSDARRPSLLPVRRLPRRVHLVHTRKSSTCDPMWTHFLPQVRFIYILCRYVLLGEASHAPY